MIERKRWGGNFFDWCPLHNESETVEGDRFGAACRPHGRADYCNLLVHLSLCRDKQFTYQTTVSVSTPVRIQGERAESMDDPPGNLDDLRSRVQQWASKV